jgi:hypothetical protein
VHGDDRGHQGHGHKQQEQRGYLKEIGDDASIHEFKARRKPIRKLYRVLSVTRATCVGVAEIRRFPLRLTTPIAGNSMNAELELGWFPPFPLNSLFSTIRSESATTKNCGFQ